MMSVASMSAGQGGYYAGLAQEDYYLKGGEPPGLWMGEGAKKLGLFGTVNKAQFLELFDGFKDGEKLVQNAGKENHRPGWDLTFSAPKTVSTAWSQADLETQLEIQAAHLTAVEKAIEYLEQNALWTRRGKGGVELESCQGVVATFEHGTSRAQDPQLHTHALLLNIGVREDGKTSTLETRAVFLAKMTAGALYRSELAYQLERRLGLFAEPRTKDTSFDLKGVSKELAETFSTRRKEILAALEAKGLTSSKAAEVAALDTRSVKGHISREELFEKCRAVGKEHGWSREELNALMKGPQKERAHGDDLKKACVQATDKITQQSAYFTARDLLRRVAEGSQTLATGAQAVQTAVAEHLKDHEQIVRIGHRHKEAVYSTREMVALEKDLMKMAKEGASGPWGRVSERTLEAINSERPTMKPEQWGALRHITQKTGSVCSVTGMAGTGKTFMLAAAREALEASGYRVLGAALAGKAAAGLQEGANIKSYTIARVLRDLNNPELSLIGHSNPFWKAPDWSPLSKVRLPTIDPHRKGLTLDEKTVLVIDEAGMVGTRQMHQLMTHVQKAGSKLVLVGDEKQLQPIDAGGPFGAISREIGTAKLTDIVRQREKWQRQAVKDFANGEATKGLEAYARRGFVSVATHQEAARKALLDAWQKKGLEAPEKNLIVAATNADAKALNQKIQALRLEKEGPADRAKVRIDGQDFFGGDRILFTRNSQPIGVKNGTLGTILSVGHKVTVTLDNGEKQTFSPKQYEHVKLGYAVTTHKAQGATVDNVFILTNEAMQDRQLTYVQASRARDNARFFTTEAEAGDKLKDLAATMARSHEKVLAIEFNKSQDRPTATPQPHHQPVLASQLPQEPHKLDHDLEAIIQQRSQRKQDREQAQEQTHEI